MKSKTGKALNSAITMLTVGLLVGCAPSAYLTAKDVPTPVLLCGPSHMQTNKNVISVTAVGKNETLYAGDANSTVLGQSKRVADSGLASVEINKVLQGNNTADIQLNKVAVGSYFTGIGNWTIEKTYVKIKGGMTEAGKEIQK